MGFPLKRISVKKQRYPQHKIINNTPDISIFAYFTALFAWKSLNNRAYLSKIGVRAEMSLNESNQKWGPCALH